MEFNHFIVCARSKRSWSSSLDNRSVLISRRPRWATPRARLADNLGGRSSRDALNFRRVCDYKSVVGSRCASNHSRTDTHVRSERINIFVWFGESLLINRLISVQRSVGALGSREWVWNSAKLGVAGTDLPLLSPRATMPKPEVSKSSSQILQVRA